MTLKLRLARLEAVRGGEAGVRIARDAATFTARMEALMEAVSQGDFEPGADASPAENFARACLRGDEAAALEAMK
jgi:hypothetical protein